MNKYDVPQQTAFDDRTWPSRTISTAPRWCSVDLRDGNQALIDPMNPEQKMIFFRMLAAIGFREIEISFPSASEADYRFTRQLIADGHIPDDCRIQILTQAREHLIKKSFEAVQDAPDVIVHFYNSTSPAQREIVFKKSPAEIIGIAVQSTAMIRNLSTKHNGRVALEYSPESFSQTEPQFVIDICNSVIDTWNPGVDEEIIINLPATVEITTPNRYADAIEYVSSRLERRRQVVLSIHTHNDRGCAVAAAELGMLAGAQRVEGTLFGNGERTGNADLVTIALNLFSQGIDPGLDFSTIEQFAATYTECTGMEIPPRHPYAGNLVFTAFSGSHQDAISKGIAEFARVGGVWRVPYLPIDPKDIGRTYEGIIRINSQSGKGGAVWILAQQYGFEIPREMYPEIGAAIQKAADAKGKELSAGEVHTAFAAEFINRCDRYRISDWRTLPAPAPRDDSGSIAVNAVVHDGKREIPVYGSGNGFLDALTHALMTAGMSFTVKSYHEHSLGEGSEAKAASYVAIERNGQVRFGVGVDTDIARATILALVSALNR